MTRVLLALCVLIASVLFAADPTPRFTSVSPDTGKAGTEFTVAGENLTKGSVAEVYLTDGKNDLKCEVVGQSAAEIKIKAPENVKPGRYSLMILTGDKQRMLEQPVKVNIE
jgi:hypothetical protein